MPQGDRDFLREYVRAQPSRQKDETLTAYLRRVGVDEGDPKDLQKEREAAEATAQERTPERTPERVRANQQSQLDAQTKEAQLAAADQARKQQAAKATLIGKGLYAAGIVPNKAADTVERFQNWLATRPTPGGRGGMLLLLLVFGAFIIPVAAGGYTRAQLAWLTLLGRTELDESGEPGGRGRPLPPGGEPRGEPKATGHGPAGTSSVTPPPFPFTLPLPGGSGGPPLPS